IDHFKKINDTYGHLVGDVVLKEVARRLQEQVRREDVFARYGGEEFCLVLPETTDDAARHVAQELRSRGAETRLHVNGTVIQVTVSIGVAVVNATDRTVPDLIQRADARLYEAKRGGRDQVCG